MSGEMCKSHTLLLCLIPSSLTFLLSSLYLLQRLFPEKLSRCQWLPAVSEAVVKRPCVRLPLATITTAVIIILAVFNLVRLHSYVECLKRVIIYCAISSWLHFIAVIPNARSLDHIACLSVKFFFIPLQCFIHTDVTGVAAPCHTNYSIKQELEGDLFYLPVSDEFVNHRQY